MNVDAINNKTELVSIIDTAKDIAVKDAAKKRLATLIANGFRVGSANVNDNQVQICTDLRFFADKANRLIGFNFDGSTRWNKPFMMHRFSEEMLKWLERKEIAKKHDELPVFYLPLKPDASTRMGLSPDRFIFTWKCIESYRSLFVSYLSGGIDSLVS